MGIKHKRVVSKGSTGEAEDWNDDHEIDGNVDFLKYQAQNMAMHNLAAPPAAPATGQVYYDTTDTEFKIWDGSAWLSYVGIDTTLFIQHDGSVTYTANQSMGGYELTNLAFPTAGSSATPKDYVDYKDNFLENITPTQTGAGNQFTRISWATDGYLSSSLLYTTVGGAEEVYCTWDIGGQIDIARMYWKIGAGNAEVTVKIQTSPNGTDWTTHGTKVATGNAEGTATSIANVRYVRFVGSQSGGGGGRVGYLHELAIDEDHEKFKYPPLGTVMAWLKSYTITLCEAPTIPSNWVMCNGQVLSDSESMFNGMTMPDLNSGSKRFLRGQTTSGGTGGSETHRHTIETLANREVGASHTVSTFQTDLTSTLPTYYEVVWIMRVK